MQGSRICLLRNQKHLCGSSVAHGTAHETGQVCAVGGPAFPRGPVSNTQLHRAGFSLPSTFSAWNRITWNHLGNVPSKGNE